MHINSRERLIIVATIGKNTRPLQVLLHIAASDYKCYLHGVTIKIKAIELKPVGTMAT